MAIKIFERYGPRANPADGDYPNGSIKNESSPGTDDGTPLEKDWGNDYEGWSAALLDEAGITASGAPDTVNASQRMDAMRKIFTKAFDTVSDMQASDTLIVGQKVMVMNYTSTNESGPMFGVIVASGTGTDDGGTFIDCTGVQFKQLFNSIVNVKLYGAEGDNSTDDYNAITNCAKQHKSIYIPNATYKLSNLPDFSTGVCVKGADATFMIDTGQLTTDGAVFNSVEGLTIKGANTTDTNFTDIVSVTGSAGAWSVTATVSDVTGLSIGDFVKVSEVSPGILPPGLINSRVPRGQMNLAFFHLGTISTTGTAATISGSGANTYLASGDILIIKGEVVKINTVDSDTTFTLSKALIKDVSNIQYWYYLDNIPNGLATATGTTVTISGAFFDDFLNEGSLIAIADHGIRRVVSVDSDTTCTVDQQIEVPVGKSWGAVDFGQFHEGTWEITAISGNDVTWLNTMKTDVSIPPVKNIASGVVTKIPTSLSFTGDGVNIFSGTLTIEDVVLSGSSSGVGICVQGSQVTMAGNASVNGFSNCAKVAEGGSLIAIDQHFVNASSTGVYLLNGGDANLQGSTINGNGGIGVLETIGSAARMADSRISGNGSHGVRMEVGASTWMDFAYVEANAADGVLAVGGTLGHFVGVRAMKNLGDGISTQNGMYGRASGMIAISNAANNLIVSTGQMEATQINCIAAGIYGVNVLGGYVKLLNSGIEGSSSNASRITEIGRLDITGVHVLNHTDAINCSDESLVFGDEVGFDGNTTDVTVLFGGKVNLQNSSPFTSNVTKNTFGTSFEYVADGTAAP